MIDLLQNGLYSQIAYPSEGALILGTLGCILAAALLPYLLGSLNTSILISRLLFRDDVRTHGSGNAGLSNMLRTFGAKGAVLTLLGDILKTALCIFIGGLFMGLQYQGPYAVGFGGYMGMFFCVLGHTFPVFYRFKGGKGVLCSAIGIAILSPYVFLILLLVFAILVAFTKYISLGSIVASAMYPLFLNLMFKVSYTSTPPAHAVLCSFLMAAMVVWMHRSNISRLWHGEENKLSFRHHEVNTSDKENGEDPEK